MPTAQPAAQSPPPAQEPKRPGLRFIARVAVALVILGGLTALLGCGSSKKAAATTQAPHFQGATITPPTAAPALSTLRNYTGEPVNLAAYRGKAVLVTFLYTHCPDVCPLIASSLHNTLSALGARAADVRLIAVSVDPRGDTKASVAAFLRKHQLVGQMQYLVGSAHELAPVWNAWHVGSEQDVGNPELVNHSALIYGVSASGKLTTLYDASFQPSEVVHDLPGLLSS